MLSQYGATSSEKAQCEGPNFKSDMTKFDYKQIKIDLVETAKSENTGNKKQILAKLMADQFSDPTICMLENEKAYNVTFSGTIYIVYLQQSIIQYEHTKKYLPLLNDVNPWRYGIIGPILGRGSFGQVHLLLGRIKLTKQVSGVAYDIEIKLKEDKVLKILRKENPLGFENEFKISRSYYASKGLSVKSANLKSKKKYFILPRIKGKSLLSFLEQNPLLYFHQRIGMALYFIEQLADFHAKGHAHRDLKPDNILIDTSAEKIFQLSLIDFGFSANENDKNKLCGSPIYIAPEVFIPDFFPHVKTDVYVAGLVLMVILGLNENDLDKALTLTLEEITKYFKQGINTVLLQRKITETVNNRNQCLEAIFSRFDDKSIAQELIALKQTIENMISVDPISRPDISVLHQKFQLEIRNIADKKFNFSVKFVMANNIIKTFNFWLKNNQISHQKNERTFNMILLTAETIYLTFGMTQEDIKKYLNKIISDKVDDQLLPLLEDHALLTFLCAGNIANDFEKNIYDKMGRFLEENEGIFKHKDFFIDESRACEKIAFANAIIKELNLYIKENFPKRDHCKRFNDVTDIAFIIYNMLGISKLEVAVRVNKAIEKNEWLPLLSQNESTFILTAHIGLAELKKSIRNRLEQFQFSFFQKSTLFNMIQAVLTGPVKGEDKLEVNLKQS